MLKKGQGMQNIIVLVVAIIIGISAGITIFVDLGITQQTIKTVGLEEFSTTNNVTSVQLDNLKIVTNSEVVRNATESGGTALVKDAEYIINYRLGKIRVINGTTLGADWNISYNYKPTSYAESGTTRTILGLLPLLLAIGLIILVGRNMIQGG